MLMLGRPENGTVAVMLLSLATLSSHPAWSADWTLSKQLTTQVTYTDNLLLNATNKKSDVYVEITPGLVVTGKGRRFNLDLAYSPQYLHYFSSGEDDVLNHRLQANAQSELYQDHLFLDASATAQQELINALGPSSRDAINPTGNLQTSYTYSLAPRYQNRFGQTAKLDIGVENNGVFYSDVGSNSIGYKSHIDLSSGTASGKLSWGITAEHERIEYADSASNQFSYTTVADQSTTQFSKTSGTLGYQINPHWHVDTRAGYEDNNYVSLNETSGALWEASSLWTPSPRTSLRAGVSYRYFGWAPVLEFSHRSKRSAWTASFTRDVSSARNERMQNNVYSFKDAFGEPVVPVTGDALTVLPNGSIPISSTFISNTFQTGYTLSTRRSTFGASLGYVLRQYEGLTQDEETANATLFWTRRLTQLTSSNLTLGWDRTQRRDTAADNTTGTGDQLTVNAGLTRKLSERANLDLQYRFLDGADYSENRVTLGLRMNWSD